MQIGSRFVIYFDHYREPKRYEAIMSPDLEHWTAINDQVSFPGGCKHGSFLRITRDEARRLRAFHSFAQARGTASDVAQQ